MARAKEKILKPKLIEGIDRLKKLVEMDAPGVIVGAAAWNLYVTTLGMYGKDAGIDMVQHLIEENLHSRGICAHGDCTRAVDRPNLGVCSRCIKDLELGAADSV